VSSDLDTLVERKVGERLNAIEKGKSDAESSLRLVRAVVGGGVGWWLGTKFGAHGDNLLWAIGAGAFLGALHEILSLAIFLILVVSLSKCIG
jgi:hypothetical protein